jgi:ADP-heptose:LPS heptosyltransferase
VSANLLPMTPAPDRELPDSILIVRLGAIGDVTNALVLAEALRTHAPSIRIGWAVHPLAAPLVVGHPAIDRAHVWPREHPVAGFRRLRAELRRERYGLAIDLQRLTKSACLARASGAPRVLGYDRGRAKELSWLWTRERIPAGDPRAHMVTQVLEFARYLGVPEPGVRHRFPPDPAAESWAEELVAGLGAAPILVAIGASKPANRWPPERFGRLAAALAEERAEPVVLLGGPGDRAAGEVALGEGAPGVTSLVGQTSLPQLIALLARGRALVSCDTGAMHLGVAQNLPVIALFGPADARRTGPWGPGHRVVREPEWDPAAPHRPAPMGGLTTKRVLDEVLAHLATNGLPQDSPPARGG